MNHRRTTAPRETAVMGRREALAHAALHAAVRLLNDRVNGRLLRQYSTAIEQLCPECQHAILYCRCYGKDV